MYCREQWTQLQEELEDKTKTLDLLIAENNEVRSQLEEMTNRVQKAETENKMLIDRWMLQKMQDAERLNEVHGDVLFTILSLTAEFICLFSSIWLGWPYLFFLT